MNDPLPDMFADYYLYSNAFPLLGIHCESTPALERLRNAFADLAGGHRIRTTSDDLLIYGLRRARTISFEVDTTLPDQSDAPGSVIDPGEDGVVRWRGTPVLWSLAREKVETLMESPGARCCHFLPGDYADDSHVCIELGGPAWDTFRQMMRSAP